MGQFTKRTPKAPAKGRFTNTTTPALTHEGGSGYAKDEKTALYTLALVERFSGNFYETSDDRLERMVKLALTCSTADPVWTAGFANWLRNGANTRSAALLVAACYAHAHAGAGNNTRAVVDSVCQRADEPAELVAAYISLFGKNLPAGLKKGVSDAVHRLYTEYGVLKYNRSGMVSMRDVLNLAHPSGQNPVFKYIIDQAYDNELDLRELPMVAARRELMNIPEGARRAYAAHNPEHLKAAGFTWENLSSWLPGGMDAQGWELAIPQMGYMARLRNLRNFEQAGVSKPVLRQVRDYIADPVQVERSKQLPYRFWSAYRFTQSDFFTSALADAFDHSLRNVPELDGKTLIMVDTSGSMQSSGYGYGANTSKIPPVEQASVLACGANAKWDATVWAYASSTYRVDFANNASALRNVQHIQGEIGKVGYGTNTWPSTQQALHTDKFDRVIVLTDMQDHPGGRLPGFDGPIYVWDLAGYPVANIDTKKGRYLFGGFDDHAFGLIGQLEAGAEANWPWL